MKRLVNVLFVAALFFGLVSVVSAQDTGTEEITVNSVPQWIMDTAQRAGDQFFVTVTLDSVQFDPEGDLPTYEFSGAAEGVMGFEIDIYPDGTLEEVEETIAEGDAPSAVMDVLSTYFPNLEMEQVERSTRPGKNGLYDIYYEFTGMNDGQDVDIEINEDASMILIELPTAS